jgi:hypothetical protein
MRSAPTVGLLALVALTAGCAGGADARLAAVGTSLEVVRVGTETGWGLVNQAALDEESAYLSRIAALPHAERPARADAEARVEAIRAEWHPRLEAFQAVRDAHTVALVVFDDVVEGREPFESLLSILDELRRLYVRVDDVLGGIMERDE